MTQVENAGPNVFIRDGQKREEANDNTLRATKQISSLCAGFENAFTLGTAGSFSLRRTSSVAMSTGVNLGGVCVM